MWVTRHLKCPDQGTAYQLISVTEEGEAKLEAYLSKEQVQQILSPNHEKMVKVCDDKYKGHFCAKNQGHLGDHQSCGGKQW